MKHKSYYRITEKQESFLRILLNNAHALHIFTYLNLDANHLDTCVRTYASYAINVLLQLIRENDYFRALSHNHQVAVELFTYFAVKQQKPLPTMQKVIAVWDAVGIEAQLKLLKDANDINAFGKQWTLRLSAEEAGAGKEARHYD